MLTEIEKNVATTSTPQRVTTHEDSQASPVLTPLNLREGEPSEKPEILEEVVIEEVSIDGMCGVY
jgi:mycofactocin precursor